MAFNSALRPSSVLRKGHLFRNTSKVSHLSFDLSRRVSEIRCLFSTAFRDWKSLNFLHGEVAASWTKLVENNYFLIYFSSFPGIFCTEKHWIWHSELWISSSLLDFGVSLLWTPYPWDLEICCRCPQQLFCNRLLRAG